MKHSDMSAIKISDNFFFHFAIATNFRAVCDYCIVIIMEDYVKK